MSEKYYIDAAIWRDLHENRVDKFRPLGEWAFELFKRIRENKEKVLYSELIVEELSVAYDKKSIDGIFEDMADLLEKVEIKKQHLIEANMLSKKLNIPFGDCLHAVLARENKAIMVTRDHHFEELHDIVEVKKPEELI